MHDKVTLILMMNQEKTQAINKMRLIRTPLMLNIYDY